MAAALNHPNLCTIYAVDDSAGVPIISMEYIAGQPLSKAIRPGQLPAGSLLSITRQIASGMAAAHAAGIVHGDLKPENVMVTAEGVVKVLDFGLARRLRRGRMVRPDETAELGLAEAGDGLFGTPRYLSPEQVRGEPATHSSDVFSLGILFYELSTGTPAFPGEHLLVVLDQIRSVDSRSQWPLMHPTLLTRSCAGCSRETRTNAPSRCGKSPTSCSRPPIRRWRSPRSSYPRRPSSERTRSSPLTVRSDQICPPFRSPTQNRTTTCPPITTFFSRSSTTTEFSSTRSSSILRPG